jgi:dTDP-4-amino-4,6-dideoxygalactose transaminase
MSNAEIKVANPGADLGGLREQLIAAARRVIDSGSYILGNEVEQFESRMAERLGVVGTIGVASGTDALALGLLGVGIGPGDEVITVSHTAGATAAAILMIGAVPVLIDIEPETYCIDVNQLEAALGPKTRAVVPVHLYGHPAAIGAVEEFADRHGLAVVEDCAQAQESSVCGITVGSTGDVGCFSFYPTKILGAIGGGGLVATRRRDLLERLRQLRIYGWSKSQFSELPSGRCSRLDEIQAAFLQLKLDSLDKAVERRRTIAQFYSSAFSGLDLSTPTERPGHRHVFHLYVIRCAARNALAHHLKAAGIATARHYPFPVHQQPGLAATARVAVPLGVTEKIQNEILTLPLYPSMSHEEQCRVVDGVRQFFGR